MKKLSVLLVAFSSLLCSCKEKTVFDNESIQTKTISEKLIYEGLINVKYTCKEMDNTTYRNSFIIFHEDTYSFAMEGIPNGNLYPIRWIKEVRSELENDVNEYVSVYEFNGQYFTYFGYFKNTETFIYQGASFTR